MIDKEDIVALAERIARGFAPERIILFDSYAYGTPTEDSDVDLLVVLPFEGNHTRKAIEILNKTDPHFPIDLLARTPDVVQWRVEQGDFFLHEIVERGQTLYEAAGTHPLRAPGRRQYAPTNGRRPVAGEHSASDGHRASGLDRPRTRATGGLADNSQTMRNPLTDEWLAKAERDYAAAERNHSPAAHVFIYHDATVTLAEWAAEGYLKAVLQEHCIASGKGHDLPALCDLLAPVDPAWADLREQARELEHVAAGAGYPRLESE